MRLMMCAASPLPTLSGRETQGYARASAVAGRQSRWAPRASLRGEVRKELLDVAAQMLDADPEDLVLRNGRAEIVGAETTRPSLSAPQRRPASRADELADRPGRT
jgi:hypothetical protein